MLLALQVISTSAQASISHLLSMYASFACSARSRVQLCNLRDIMGHERNYTFCRVFGNPGSEVKEPHGPALTVNMTKRLLRGSREEHLEMIFTVEALAAQICPAALYPLKAVLHTASVPSAVQRPPGIACRQALAHFEASAYKSACTERTMSKDDATLAFCVQGHPWHRPRLKGQLQGEASVWQSGTHLWMYWQPSSRSTRSA